MRGPLGPWTCLYLMCTLIRTVNHFYVRYSASGQIKRESERGEKKVDREAEREREMQSKIQEREREREREKQK